MRKTMLCLLLAATPVVAIVAQTPSRPLAAAVAAPTRTPANVARDGDRHPAQTLAFFGIKPHDNVVELWPFGGWYTEILAPYLAAGGGTLTEASPPGRFADQIAKKLDSDPATYGKVKRANFPSKLGGDQVAPGSVDVVLTFRNIHNWRMGFLTTDKADYSEGAFRDIYTMLKPGGTLGIEDHHLPEEMDTARERSSGYMKISTVRALAEKAGFRFVAASTINANPRDTHDYASGVWTLPPTYRDGDKDRARYAAIGESDRMTLKFVKPRG
ncbi:class I SAM-dependent methyltransferase [Sphingomonas bacterium]|uniref:class I SAM-dependent methyltransferase n=1 Tax=Sphingomonas bacterium TaxID=1895847 RepID=UPI001576F689|nr:class I SAM-dependent methyltransferase [Sphingomonas bacterium]